MHMHGYVYLYMYMYVYVYVRARCTCDRQMGARSALHGQHGPPPIPVPVSTLPGSGRVNPLRQSASRKRSLVGASHP